MRKKASALVLGLALAVVMVPSAAFAALTPSLSQVINPGTLSVDIVDGSNVPIASPSVAFGATTFDFACQTTTATLGTASQKLQVKNPKKSGVKVDINATTPGNPWSDGGTNSYKYNDATGSGCTNGQMTISGGTFTKTAGAGSPAYTMPVGAFTSTASVTLLNNTGNFAYNADLTNYTLSQKIPAEQTDGTYSLPMTVTFVQQ